MGIRMLEAFVIEQPKPVWEEGVTCGMHASPQEQIIATKPVWEDGGAFLVVHKSQ